MRFILGFVLGVVITIGAAYVHDRRAAGPSPDSENRQMVNWGVVHQNFRQFGANIDAEWNRLTDQLRHKT